MANEAVMVGNAALRLGSTVDTSKQPDGAVVKTSVCRASAAGLGRVWAVHLLPWRAAGQDTNQTWLDNAQAIITLGADQVQEQITVDYPSRGACFTVGAQTVEVTLRAQVPSPSTVANPIIGAYLSASTRAPMMGATFTNRGVVAPNAGQIRLDVPNRARGYRLMWTISESAFPATLLHLLQLRGDLSLAFPLADDLAGDANGFFVCAENRQAWFPLHADASFLVLNNTHTASWTGEVQWLLELAA